MRRPIPFQSRSIPYQFRARTALRGLGALRRGLGLTCPPGQNLTGPNPEFPQGVCLTNCGDTSIYSTVGSQYACEQQNQAAINAAGYEGPTNAPPVTPVSTSPPPTPTYSPRLSFNTSRGGSTVYPGDTWTIQISGAPPSQPVSVLGVHPDGGSATQGYGNTDGSGSFALAGAITADMVGNWQETWSVGGQQVGSFSFTVNPTPQQTMAPAPAPQVPAATQQTYVLSDGTTATTSTSGSSLTDFISSIPWWGWGIAAVGGVMLFSGGRR